MAQAQSKADLKTAIGNTYMSNANEINPYGTVNYRRTGFERVGGEGKRGMNVPTWQRTVKLSPAEQKKLNQQNQISFGLNDVALQQTQKIGGLLGTPIGEIEPARAETPYGTPIQQSVGANDFSADRTKVEEALYSRLNPQLDRDRQALESKLVNQGFALGSAGFNEGMDQFNRQANDARMQTILAGGAEQSRLFGMDMSKGQFANSAQQQGYDQSMASASFQNNSRQQALQEMLALRNQPINEISTLMNGGQVNMPQFQPFQYSPMSRVPIGDYTYQSADLAQKNYQAAVSQNNAAMGGMFGLGGAAIQGLMAFSDRRLKKNVIDLGVTLRNGAKLYAYEYHNEDIPRVGVMAQEIEQIMPEAVSIVRGWKAVDYGKLLEAA